VRDDDAVLEVTVAGAEDEEMEEEVFRRSKRARRAPAFRADE
jgi:hypothetical protein